MEFLIYMLTSSEKYIMEVLAALSKTEKTTDWFEVQTGVRQGCLMSGFLFIIVVDWIMRNTNNRTRGIRWKFMSQSTLATCKKDQRTEAYFKKRLGLARSTFSPVNNFWKSALYSTKTKLRMFSTNVISMLLYCSELWRTTENDAEKFDTFHGKCLWRIWKIH